MIHFKNEDRCDRDNVTITDFPQYDGYDKNTANGLLVLAALNMFVLIEGIYCFHVLLQE